MSENSKIKIVKKHEASSLRVKKRKMKKPANGALDMVATVSEWVTDFKIRKSAETKTAFDIFLASNPRPSES